jgi:WD40 repeat protein
LRHTLEMVCTQEPTPPRQLQPSVSRDLDAICMKCIQKDPSKRYATATDLADDLIRFLRHEPISNRPIGIIERSQKWARRRPIAAGLLGLSLLATVSLLIGGLYVKDVQQLKSEMNSEPAVLLQEKQAERQLLLKEAERQLLLREAELTPFMGQTLKGHPDLVSRVAFSPDGKHLATASDDRTARLWDVSTGQQVLEFKGHTDAVLSVAFSPDGALLATAGDDKTARLWDERTGNPLLELKGHTGAVRSVTFSPDGKDIVSGSQDQTVNVWDAATGVPRLTLKGHTSTITSVAFTLDGKHIVSTDEGHAVKVWDAQTGAEELSMSELRSPKSVLPKK